MAGSIRRRVMCAVALLGMAAPIAAVTWFPLGPYGGDARSFAMDPQNSQHLFMGTATGWLYESTNGGSAWKRLSMVGKRDDIVVRHILVDPLDPKHVLVGAYAIDREDGGLFESHDSGLTWYSQAEIRGQSVRALTGAPSDPKIMVAGTLKGVYQTSDAGVHWKLISPEGSTEIHEVESIAIDPQHPNVIYAGTWHLPWKTVDGGEHWTNIKQGIIDDSDVFSIIVDPAVPQTVYASACSGIYKSVDGGGKFSKVQGIPSSARRTRRLAQDPQHLDTVYAGTTQGLYRTLTGGTMWSLMTAPDVIVNDVFIDPKNENHVLLATDRAGVLASEDGGVSFKPSNTGFSARQVTSFAADPHRSSTIYVGVVNDKAAGGVFMSKDGGVNWEQQSAALDGRDVFSLASTSGGTLLAGTGHGIFRLDDGLWAQSGTLSVLPAEAIAKPTAAAMSRPVAKTTGGKSETAMASRRGTSGAKLRLVEQKRSAKKTAKVPPAKRAPVKAQTPAPSNLDAAVYAMAPAGDAIYAGTSQGLMKGTGDGRLWANVSSLQMPETRFVAAWKETVMVANMKRIALSMDGGGRWDPVALPEEMTQVSTIAVDEVGNLWVGGHEGAFYSTDYGLHWKRLHNLFVRQVTNIYFDAANHRVLVAANDNNITFSVRLPDYNVQYWDTGWSLRFVRPAGDHLIGVTMYDGVVVQPVMVDSKIIDAK